jgi:hypothetical protein
MRRSIRPVLALVSVLAVAACGSGGGGTSVQASSGFKALRAASSTTAEAGPARMKMTMRIAGQEIVAEGVADVAGRHVTMEMDLPGVGTMRVRGEGTTMLMQLPQSAMSTIGVSTPWVSVDLKRAAEAASGLAGGGLTSAGSNPGDVLATLEGVSEHGVHEVGDDTLHGVRTTHYRAEIDLEKALRSSASIVDADTFDRFVKQLGSRTTTQEVWLDADGVVRQIAFEYFVQGQKVAATLELYDFGQVELPAPPPATDVTDITDQAIEQAKSQQ